MSIRSSGAFILCLQTTSEHFINQNYVRHYTVSLFVCVPNRNEQTNSQQEERQQPEKIPDCKCGSLFSKRHYPVHVKKERSNRWPRQNSDRLWNQ